jgi:hypothetical protein
MISISKQSEPLYSAFGGVVRSTKQSVILHEVAQG